MVFFNKLNFFKGKAKVFFLLLLLAGIFCFGGSGRAQQDPRVATAVQVSPVRFDWNLNDGEERTAIVNLKNYSAEPYDVEIQVEDFYVTDDTIEARFFIPNKDHPLFAYDVINWIENPQNLTLEPGEGRDVYFKIKVPDNAPTGGYYGALFFKTSKHSDQNTANDGSSKVIINQRVGVLLVMAVKGQEPIKRSGELQIFKALQKIFWESPVKLEADVTNNGNIHYKALGFLDIYKFGKKIDSVQIDQRMLYPGKYRKYETKWNFSPWAYGFYKAKFNLFSEDMQIKVEGETSFWVIPWKTTLAIIILIFIIWMIYKLFDSRFEIRKKEEDDDDNHGTQDMKHETWNMEQENDAKNKAPAIQPKKKEVKRRIV